MEDMEQQVVEVNSLDQEISEVEIEKPEPVEVSLDASEEEVPLEALEEKQKRPRKSQDGLSRIKQLSREKYHAEYLAKKSQEEAAQLRAEVERYKTLSEQNSQAAMSHFDDSVKRQLDQARIRMTKAIQEGDVEEQIRAQEDLAEAKAKQLQIDSWNANQSYVKQQNQFENRTQQPNQHAQKYVDVPVDQPQLTPEAHAWIEANSWINPNSYDFDEPLAREVQAYEGVLYNKYIREGKQDKLLSKEYFDDIDNYVRAEIYGEQVQKPTQSQRTMNMRSTRAPVAPVSHTRMAQQNVKPKFRLPDGLNETDLKKFIANLGADEKTFMNNMKDHLNETRLKNEMLMREGRFQ